jgi:hypothetical protein
VEGRAKACPFQTFELYWHEGQPKFQREPGWPYGGPRWMAEKWHHWLCLIPDIDKRSDMMTAIERMQHTVKTFAHVDDEAAGHAISIAGDHRL